MNSKNLTNASPFDLSIWKRASIERRYKRERKRLSLLDEVDKALNTLNLTYEWEEVYLFGSITRPNQFFEKSDIDIGIEGLHKFSHYRFVAEISRLMDRSVDVVRLEDCSFADVIRTRGKPWKKKR